MLHRLTYFALIIICLVVVSALPSTSTGQTKNNETSAKIKTLMKERRDVLAKRVEFFHAQFENAKSTRVPSLEARDDLIAAEIDLAETRNDRIELLKSRAANLKDIEESYMALRRNSKVEMSEVLMATSNRLLAEIALERAIAAE